MTNLIDPTLTSPAVTLPMTGAAPDWTSGTPADALHRAGLTYVTRAQAVAR